MAFLTPGTGNRKDCTLDVAIRVDGHYIVLMGTNTNRTIIRTFEVNTNWGFVIDEVDGRGATADEALADARAQADDLYGPDAELVEIEAGGCGLGLVQF